MQEKNSRQSNEARSSATINTLLEVAYQLFAENGYAATSTPDIVKAAGVTRGALYHHFANKEVLFRAVIERESAHIAREIDEKTQNPTSVLNALLEGSDAYFEAISNPDRARLLLIEAPSVLGPDIMAEIDQANGGNELKKGLDMALEQGLLKATSTAALADILSAAFDRAALAVANGQDAFAYKQAIRDLMVGVLKAS